MSLCFAGCGNNSKLLEEINATNTEVVTEQENTVMTETEEVKEPETIYQMNIGQTVFEDVQVLSDSLYAYKLSGDTNWTVARCADDTVLDIVTGEGLVANLQDNTFAFNTFTTPNNYLYDSEGNLLWEATGKVTDEVGPTINYSEFVISGYADDVLYFEQRDGFATVYINELDYQNILQVIGFGRVHGMPFANGYLTTDINYKSSFGIFNVINQEQERITLEYEDYYMSIYDSSVSENGWVYVNFTKKNLFGKDDTTTIAGFYNVETGEARFLEDFYAVDIKHFPENGNNLSPEKNGIAVMYGEQEVWYGKFEEHVQESPHYIVYNVEEGTILAEDLRDVKLSDHKYALIQGQDEKWQYADAATFDALSEMYDVAALYQDGIGVVLMDGQLMIIDEEFNVLSVEDQSEVQDVESMGFGYYKVKQEDGYRLMTISVEVQ